MPSIQLKTAALAPIPTVRHRIASSEKPGAAAEHAQTEVEILKHVFDEIYVTHLAAFLLYLLDVTERSEC
jgi:hypothetical protein